MIQHLGLKEITCELFKSHLLERLFKNLSDDNVDIANYAILKLLEIDIEEYECWRKFILDKQEEKVIYHTYHGTKGREFDNVIIIMENSFGRKKDTSITFLKITQIMSI